MSAQNFDQPPKSDSSLPPAQPTPSKFLILLPWLLLLLLILAGLWLFTHDRLDLQKQNSAPITVNNSNWQPPKADPVPKQTLNNNSNAPISSYHNAVAVAAQSVVNIYTTQKVTQHPYMNDPMLRRFYEQHGMPQEDGENTNLGSGVIISPDGYIVTNSHVISQADNIIVMLNDGRKATAKLVGTDPESDLAVIKVALTGLKPLGFKETATQVGDVVLAIGNPFGVGQTVTQGIISATGRTGLGINTVEDFIQTDAAINPGNSGGALVDAYGQLVGINTAIFSRSGGSMGIGFAIPTNIVEHVINSIIKEGRVRRGWLGIELQSRLKDPTILSEDSAGVEVVDVLADGPAKKAGLQKGDIILAMDDQPVNDANTLIQLIARKAPNSTVKLTIKRTNSTGDVQVNLGERQPQPAMTPITPDMPFSGPDDSQMLPNGGPSGMSRNRNQGAANDDDLPPELMELLRR